MEAARLLERDEAIAAVTGLLDNARAGSGGALFLVGEPGVGKTAMLAWAVARATGMAVAEGLGAEMEGTLPFGLLAQVVDGLGMGSGDLPDGFFEPAVEPTAPHYRVLRHLQRRTGPPILLALDDLHWADRDSLGLFAFLARRLERLPIAVVAGLRPWPTGAYDECLSLVSSGHATMSRLAPLSRESATSLLAQKVGGAVSPANENRAWQLCQGNPLLVGQLALAIGRGEVVPDASDHAASVSGHVLLSRFAGLDTPSMAYVRAASVLGTTFDPEVVAAAADLDGPAADRAVDALYRNGLVEEGAGGSARFSHPLLAQALYDDTAPPVRRRLHARYVHLLVARGQDNEASEHAMRAGMVGDPQAGALLQRTGEAALTAGAVDAATRHLEAAVRILGAAAPPGLRVTLSQALAAGGRLVEAARVCGDVLDGPALPWEDRVAALRISGRALYFTGSADHGEAAMQEASAIAAANDPGAAVDPLLDQSLCVWLSGGAARALPLAARARDQAARATSQRLRARAEATWGHLAYEAGDPAGLIATAVIGHQLGGDDRAELLHPADLAWPWAPVYQYAMNENYAGRYGASQEAFALAADALEQAGAVNAMATVAIHLANVAIRRGQLVEALRQAARAEEFAELTPTIVPYAQLVRAEALVWSGRFDESEACCASAEASGARDWFVRLWLAYVRGMRLLWQGDKAASAMFLLAEEITEAAGIREPCHMQWWAHAVAAHLGAERVADAQRVVASLDVAAASLPCPWPKAAAHLGRARIAALSQDDAAGAEFGKALEVLETADLPLMRVEALLAYGGFLRRQGHRIDARPLFAEALAVAEATDADGLAATARAELALAGGRPRRPADDPTRLTEAERRVARHAAAGLSNADIARALYLSVHTVESHLKRIFAKLGLTSRRQLMTAVGVEHTSA